MESPDEQPHVKRQRSGNAWLRAWAWKREHRPDKVRFARPYLHPFGDGSLTIHQQRFQAEGFASTVWDSSIVLAKYFELHSARYKAKRCLDLSAGCGLPGIVLSRLGAQVTATDLAPNLPLLEKNAAANGEGEG
jgi:predicted nicotinamide N-methyase